MATKDRTSLKNDFANGKYATGEKFADLIDSMKVVQLPVVDPQALGTSLSFIDSISQDEDGKITATKKTLDLANAHELNPFKGWYKTGDTLPTDGFDGAYLYFKDTSEQTGLTTIYRWNGTAYADTGTVVDTSNVQTFETGQAVNGVAIDGTGLSNPASNALAKAGDVATFKADLSGQDVIVAQIEGQDDYYTAYTSYNGCGTKINITETTTFNTIIFPKFRGGNGTNIKYLVGYNDSSDNLGIPNGSLTQLASGIVIGKGTSSPITGYSITLDEPVTLASGNAVYVLLYAESGNVGILGGGTSSTETASYSSNDVAVVFLNSADKYSTAFSESWIKASTTSGNARYRVCSPKLKLFNIGRVPKLEEDVENLNDRMDDFSITDNITENSQSAISSGGVYKFVYGIEEAIYNSSAAKAYYTSNVTGTNMPQYNCIGCTTPEATTQYRFNKLSVPYRLGNSASKTIYYWIWIGVSNGLTTPSDQTKGRIVKSGTIVTPLEDAKWRNLELLFLEPQTVAVGECVAVYFSCESNIRLYGHKYSSSPVAPPQNYAIQKCYYISDYVTNAITSTWSKGGGGTGSSVAIYPSLDLVEAAELPNIIGNAVINNTSSLTSKIKGAKLRLPKKVFGVVGDTLQLFYRGLVQAVNPYNYDIKVKASNGRTYPKYWEFKPTSAGTMDINMSIIDDAGIVINTADMLLVNHATPSNPQSNVNVYCLGDSLTSGGEWAMEFKRRLVGSNADSDGITGNGLSNITFCGSMEAEGTEVNVNYFGAGGKSWGWYMSGVSTYWYHVNVGKSVDINVGDVYSVNGNNLTVEEIDSKDNSISVGLTISTEITLSATGTMTKVSGSGDGSIEYTDGTKDRTNPLWDSTNEEISFAHYCGENTPDVFCVLLSWNGQGAWKEYSATEEDPTFGKVFEFANALHEAYPNCKLYLMGIQLPSLNGGLAANYKSDHAYSDCYGLITCAFNYNKALEDFCNLDDFKDFCTYVPIAAQFDSENNMKTTTKKVNTRNTATEVVGSNGVHPALKGYKQIADAVYRVFVNDFC